MPQWFLLNCGIVGLWLLKSCCLIWCGCLVPPSWKGEKIFVESWSLSTAETLNGNDVTKG